MDDDFWNLKAHTPHRFNLEVFIQTHITAIDSTVFKQLNIILVENKLSETL